MTKVTSELTASADGYSAGLSQTEERPFGDDGGDGWGTRCTPGCPRLPRRTRPRLTS